MVRGWKEMRGLFAISENCEVSLKRQWLDPLLCLLPLSRVHPFRVFASALCKVCIESMYSQFKEPAVTKSLSRHHNFFIAR